MQRKERCADPFDDGGAREARNGPDADPTLADARRFLHSFIIVTRRATAARQLLQEAVSCVARVPIWEVGLIRNQSKIQFSVAAVLLVSFLAAGWSGTVTAATCATGGPVLVVQSNYQTCSIQDGVDNAAAGNTILVGPGTYTESVTVPLVGVTICSSDAAMTACTANAANVIVDGQALGFLVTATDVTIDGFTVEVGGSGSNIRGIDASFAAGQRATIRNNVVVASPVSGQAIGGESGILGHFIDATIENNDVSRFRQAIYLRPASRDTTVGGNNVHENLEGFLSYAKDTLFIGNTIGQNGIRGIRLADASGSSSTGIVLRDNTFFANPVTIEFTQASGSNPAVSVDGRLNNWGVTGCEAIGATIKDDGRGNTVDFTPWLQGGVAAAPLRVLGNPLEGACGGPGSLHAFVAAVPSTSTILVAPGTYSGTLTVANSVTLCAVGSLTGTTCPSVPRTDTVIDAAGAFMYAVQITAPDVAIRGFTIQNPQYRFTDADYPHMDPSAVVVYATADRTVISGNIIQQPVAPASVGTSRKFVVGVNIAGADDVVVSGNTIRDLPSAKGPEGTCLNAPCRTVAVNAWGGGTTLVVSGNQIPNNPGNGIMSDHPSTTVSGNMIDGVTSPDLLFSHTGVTVSGGAASISGNTITEYSIGVLVAAGASTVSAVDNTFDLIDWGLQVYGTNPTVGVTINDNSFTNARAASAKLVSPRAYVLNGNVFDASAPATLFFDNNAAGHPVDARFNDWGAYSSAAIDATMTNPAFYTVDTSCFVDGAAFICPPTADFTAPSVAHFNNPVSFTDTSTSGGRTITSRSWDFGDGSTSTKANPSHTYGASGPFSVTLTVVDAEGFTGTVTKVVTTTNSAPVITAPGAISATEGDFVRFYIPAADPDGDRLTWSVTSRPGGSFLTPLPNGTLLFRWTLNHEAAGVYTPTFTVTDGELSDSTTVTITVTDANAAPFASFFGPTVASPGVVVTYTSTSTDKDGTIANWTWTFSDGVTMWGTPVSRSFAGDGTYIVTLTVTDDLGAIGTTTPRTIHVDGTPPVTTFTVDQAGYDDGVTQWYADRPTFTVTATDVSNVRSITTRLDNGPEVKGPKVTVEGAGAHTLDYWAEDYRNNVGAPQTHAFTIDSVAPSLAIHTDRDLPLGAGRYTYADSYEIRADVRDADSGVASVRFYVDGTLHATFAGPAVHTFVWDTSAVETGSHTVRVVATDNVGNQQASSFDVVVVNMD